MTALIFLIEQWALGLYIIFGALFVLHLWRFNRARAALRSSQFELERELAREARAGALSLMLLLLEGVVLVAGVQFVVAPTVREQGGFAVELALVADDGVFRTPTVAPPTGQFQVDSSGVQLGEVNPAPTPLPTPTLTPTPTQIATTAMRTGPQGPATTPPRSAPLRARALAAHPRNTLASRGLAGSGFRCHPVQRGHVLGLLPAALALPLCAPVSARARGAATDVPARDVEAPRGQARAGARRPA